MLHRSFGAGSRKRPWRSAASNDMTAIVTTVMWVRNRACA